MEGYHIRGGKRLSGEIKLQGAKNAALPILAATLTSGSESYIENCPNISDVAMMLSLLESIGCSCEISGDTVCIDSSNIGNCKISSEHMKGMRSSIFLTGAILGRCGEVEIGQPGGCRIGTRPIDIHLSALKSLGAEISQQGEKIICKAKNLKGTTIHLEFPSVGATENIMLAAIFAEGITKIKNSAREPEIKDLADYLNSCGAVIIGAGTSEIYIKGGQMLHATKHRIIPDRIAGGTYLAAAAITAGKITLQDVNSQDMENTLIAFRNAGCVVKIYDNAIYLKAPQKLHPISVVTAPYPGFPTDMQSPLVAMMCKASGKSFVREEIFENRFNFIKYLQEMKADIEIMKKSAIINGVSNLKGTCVAAEDLRGGAALVVAGLAAEGDTYVRHISHIERGYENFDANLCKLGADIEKITMADQL